MQENSIGLNHLEKMLESQIRNNPEMKVGSHGMTGLQKKELKQKQMLGEELEFIPANKSDDHQIKAHEAHMLHALIEKREFDSQTGEKKSKPYIQKFYPADFEKMARTTAEKKPDGTILQAENAFSGKTVKILHDPREVKVSAKKQKLSEMSLEDVKEVFFTTFGEHPSDEDSKEILIGLIEEKLGVQPKASKAPKAPIPAAKK